MTVFQGVATAMITPFSGGKTDFFTLEKLVNRQLEAGVDALVFLGSTGEPCTLTEREKLEIMRFAVKTAKGKTKLIFGCGHNRLQTALDGALRAKEEGADALLCVTPYLNKCTQNGLLDYYSAVCDRVQIPVIAYNVPARTGVNLLPTTAVKLSEIPYIAGIKDASGDLKQGMETLFLLKGKLPVYCGDDELNLPFLACGGDGLISVVSNLVPKKIVALYRFAAAGKTQRAAELAQSLYALTRACFSEVNPIPVKAALRLIGLPVGDPRAPLTRLTPENEERLKTSLQSFGLEVNA